MKTIFLLAGGELRNNKGKAFSARERTIVAKLSDILFHWFTMAPGPVHMCACTATMKAVVIFPCQRLNLSQDILLGNWNQSAIAMHTAAECKNFVRQSIKMD